MSDQSTDSDRDTRVVIVVPTYNELQNVGALTEQIFAAAPNVEILFVDDGSPDGTAAWVQQHAETNPRVHLLARTSKDGLGRAYIAGFRWALQASPRVTHIFQMDADLSHPPERVPALLRACLSGADLAIGSRYVPGGGTRGWPLHRQALSRAGGLYARTLLRLGIADPTAGFCCWRRDLLERIDLASLSASGYGFQIELKLNARRLGARIEEVPIIFTEREHGASKMTTAIATEALRVVARLALGGRGSQR